MLDENGAQRCNKDGTPMMKSINADWHVFFREGVSDAPAMLFSLTEAWCESSYCKVELVWYLVLKTMGAEEVLRTEVGGTKVGDSLTVTGVDDLQKDDVVRRVQDMKPEDRAALWDGSFFLIGDEYSASSEVVKLLLDLNCPAGRICSGPEQGRLLTDLGQFVSDERNDPEMRARQRNFARGYTTAPAYRQTAQTSATRVDVDALKRGLGAEATQVATHIRAQLASIVFPHFSFSLLPLLLPNIQLPDFITWLATWLRSLVFLDWGLLARPECFVGDETPAAEKKLLRFLTSHGGFWLIVVALWLVGAFGARRDHRPSQEQSAANHSVNASVWTFVLLHALLLRSCFETLHCVASDHVSESANDVNLWTGHLQSDPDTACDPRMLPMSLLAAVGVAAATVGPHWTASRPLSAKQTRRLHDVFELLVSKENRKRTQDRISLALEGQPVNFSYGSGSTTAMNHSGSVVTVELPLTDQLDGDVCGRVALTYLGSPKAKRYVPLAKRAQALAASGAVAMIVVIKDCKDIDMEIEASIPVLVVGSAVGARLAAQSVELTITEAAEAETEPQLLTRQALVRLRDKRFIRTGWKLIATTYMHGCICMAASANLFQTLGEYLILVPVTCAITLAFGAFTLSTRSPANRAWRNALSRIQSDEVAYAKASASVGADDAWTKAQFSEWCRTNGLAALRREEPTDLRVLAPEFGSRNLAPDTSTRKFKACKCCFPFCAVHKVEGCRKSAWLTCILASPSCCLPGFGSCYTMLCWKQAPSNELQAKLRLRCQPTWPQWTIFFAVTMSAVLLLRIALPIGCSVGNHCHAQVVTLSWHLGATGYILPALGGAGTLVYGLLIPAFLHRKLATANKARVLNSPACRHRYGFLFVRFKPGRWGAEFRILWRKTLQLLVTTAFAEQPYLVVPAQLVVLGWSIWRQYVEHPFAEMGSARRAFVEAHPGGDGWSRGDKLEMMSLGAQATNVALTGVCAMMETTTTMADDWVEDTMATAMTCCLLAPVGYAGRILQQEWAAGRRQQQEGHRSAHSETGAASEGPTSSGALGESLMMRPGSDSSGDNKLGGEENENPLHTIS